MMSMMSLMLPLPRWAVAAALGILTAAPWLAAGPLEQEIARAVRDLGDDRFRVREQASARLWKAGKAAEAALEEAIRSNDVEVVKRARSILDRFRWGIYPDTPPAILTLIDHYRSGDARLREQAIEGLLRQGLPGHEVLLKIATAEQDPAAREWFWSRVTSELPRILPTTILEGNLALAEQMLELGAMEDNEQAIRNYAACLLLRGHLEPKIKHYRERVERAPEPHPARVLAFLYRAQGDLAGARWAAERAQDAYLVDGILHEQGDWAALAARADRLAQQPNAFAGSDIENLGFRAAYHRLAGNRAGFEKALAELRREAVNASLDEDAQWFIAKALLVNGQYPEAIALLTKGENVQRAFELLCAQLRYREAFQLAAKAEPAIGLDVARARAFAQLGEPDRASAELERVGKGLAHVKNSQDALAFQMLLQAEGKLGLRDLQRSHAGLILALPEKDHLGWVFHSLYPKAAAAAQVWWSFLRQKHPQEAPATLLQRLDKLAGAQIDAAELATLAPELEQAAHTQRPQERAATLSVLATGFLAGKNEARGLAYLEKAFRTHANSKTLLRLADYYADHKDWRAAAERYRQAWEKDRSQPGPLYLQGWALSQAGKDAEGKKLMELADLVPLADEEKRFLLAEALRQRGLKGPAQRERDLFPRLSDFPSWYIDEAVRLGANDTLARKDYLKAANGYERFILSCLRPTTNMVEMESYLLVPRFVHHQRTRAHLMAGRLDEALLDARLALEAMPGSIDVAIDLVPELDRRDRKADADQLFAGVFRVEEEVCREFPKSAHHHNAAAWLGATCLRELDKSLGHAQEAVRLAPNNPSYIDTLAELHFQRGEQALAITSMKKCLELAPKRRYYLEQLKRFKAGDPKAPIPDESLPE